MRMQFYLMAALSATLMGTIGLIARYSGIDAASLTFYRLALGALILLLFLLPKRRDRHLWRRPHPAVIAGGALLAGFILSFLKAIETIPMSLAIMLVYLAPALAALVSHFVFHERLNRWMLLCIGGAFFGFAMLQEFRLDTSAWQKQGLWYALACLGAYASFILVNKRVPPSQHAYGKTFWQLLTGALCALPLVLEQPHPTGEQWAWLLVAAVFPGFLAILFAVQAIAALPARIFGTLAYLEPVTVLLIGWILFQEPMSTLQWGGAAVIITAGIGQSWLKTTRRS
ncbi:EamA family transporter [Shewanella sedimentimangrovi]|uniref:EamA family transporter n=2 Tax=Shewanella sedimentimangrovi TaxID=2814293 RepID=A0ABX7R550_9GAMM|nr:EamA family transporter [Shewanella sedimentimangrovi]